SPDGARLATAGRGGGVKLWDATTGDEGISLSGHQDGVTGVVFVPGHRQHLVSVGKDGLMMNWDAESAPAAVPAGHAHARPGLPSTPDGRLGTASGDGTIRLWDPASRRELRQFPVRTAGPGDRSTAERIAVSPDGRVVAAAVGSLAAPRQPG